MRLLASTDMALRVVMLLGRQGPGVQMNVETMAQQLGDLSRNHLHKIVQDLAALGVLRTIRGAGGGVTLAAPLEETRLGSLIRSLESIKRWWNVSAPTADAAYWSRTASCASCCATRASLLSMPRPADSRRLRRRSTTRKETGNLCAETAATLPSGEVAVALTRPLLTPAQPKCDPSYSDESNRSSRCRRHASG